MKTKPSLSGNTEPEGTDRKVAHPDSLLSSIIESPENIIIFALDRDYRYTAFNHNHQKTIKKIWGIDIEPGMNMLEIITDPKDRKKARQNFDRALNGERFTLIEEYGKHSSRRYYENTYNPILDDADNVIGLTVFLTDITEKKKIEEELNKYRYELEELVSQRTLELENTNKIIEEELNKRRQAEEEIRKFKKTIETTMQSVIITSIDGTVQYVNPSYYAFSGFEKDEVIGKSMFRFSSKEGAERLENEVIPALLTKGQWFGEMSVVKKNGKTYPAELICSLLSDEQGQPEYFVAVFTDISERKKSYEEIQKLSKVIETTIQAVVISKIDGTVVYVNQGLLKIMKCKDAQKILGRSIFDYTDDQGAEKLKNEIIPHLLSTGHWSGEMLNKRIDGTLFPSDEVCSVVTDSLGHAEYFVAIFSDITDRKQAEESLRVNEQKFRGIVENSRDVIMLTQPDGIISYLSSACSEVLGYDPEDLVGKQPWIIHPKDMGRVKKVHFNALKGKKGSSTEYRIQTKAGETRWVDHSFSPVFSDGKLQMIVSIIRNVTKQKKAEQELRESEQKYKEIFRLQREVSDNMTDMLWAKDMDKKYIFANRALCDNLLNAKDTKEPIGNTDMMFAERERKNHPDNPNWHTFGEICRDSDQVIINTKKQGRFNEYGNVKGKYIFLDVHKAPLLNDVGEMIGIVGSARDVTKEKEIQKNLVESEMKFRTLFQDSKDAIYFSSADGYFIDCNPAMETVFGCSRDELLSTPIAEFYTDQDDYFKFQELIKSQGFVSDYELSVKKKDGTIIYCLETASVRKNRTWEIIGCQGIMRDITSQKKAQTKLEKALDLARQGERVKSLFLANMSHEIRTPLNAIIGFTDLIASSTRHLVSDEEKEFFEAVTNSSKRLMHTVHEILDISQIDAGTYKLNPEIINLVELIRDIVNECRLAARNKKLALNFLSDSTPAYILADRDGLRHAVRNIIDNAIKYTEKGEVTVTLMKESPYIILTIQDTGIGIAEEYLDDLFEAFTQESEGYTKKFQGIGLGMAITKRHLDLNQVDVTIDSVKGKGTTFILTFKETALLSAEKRTKPMTGEIHATNSEEQPLILLVEDDANAQKLTGLYVRGLYHMLYAASVNEAKDELTKHSPVLILLDLSLLGDEDGLDLVRYLRETHEWRDIPIIALTAHAFNTDKDRCMAAGCNDYLSKPIKREDLLVKISEYL